MTEQDIIKETKPRMESAIDDFRRKLATVRTGRASVSLLDTVMIDYYGTPTPLNQMASVHAPEPQMLTCAAMGSHPTGQRREGDSRGRPGFEPFE
jgi:ribosome recycling factor